MKKLLQVEKGRESAERPIFRPIFQLEGGLTNDVSFLQKICQEVKCSSFNSLQIFLQVPPATKAIYIFKVAAKLPLSEISKI